MKGVSVFLVAALASGFAQAQVYKCNEGGRIVFSDYPCQKTDNKAIDVRPATGGPVNRSSEYWEKKRQREEEERAREEAELRSYEAERIQANKKADDERERRYAQLMPKREMSCSPSSKELGDFKRFDDLMVRFEEVRNVASSTPRIALSGPLLRMGEIKVDMASIQFSSECTRSLQMNAGLYVRTTMKFFQDFSAHGAEDKWIIMEMSRYKMHYTVGKGMFPRLAAF